MAQRSGTGPPQQDAKNHTETGYISSFGDVVKLEVGPSKEVFIAHKAPLMKSCTFFETALNGEWAESHAESIVLPDEEPLVFSKFLHYAYYGRCIDDGHWGFTHDTSIEDFIKLYVLADKFQTLELMEIILERLHDISDELASVPVDLLRLGYESTPAGCGLQALIWDSWILWPEKAVKAQDIMDGVPQMALGILNASRDGVLDLKGPESYTHRDWKNSQGWRKTRDAREGEKAAVVLRCG